MIKQIKHILLQQENFIQNYAWRIIPDALLEHNVWLEIMNLVNINRGKYLKHFIEEGWVQTNTPPYQPQGCTYNIPTGIKTVILNLFMEV